MPSRSFWANNSLMSHGNSPLVVDLGGARCDFFGNQFADDLRGSSPPLRRLRWVVRYCHICRLDDRTLPGRRLGFGSRAGPFYGSGSVSVRSRIYTRMDKVYRLRGGGRRRHSRRGASLAVGGFGLKRHPAPSHRGAARAGRDRSGDRLQQLRRRRLGAGRAARRQAHPRARRAPTWARTTSSSASISSGELEVELVPQGTLAERLRAGGCGIPAFYTPAGVGTRSPTAACRGATTPTARSRSPRRRKRRACSTAASTCSKRASSATSRSCARAIGDRHGNLVFHKATRNFNPLCAMAGRITIAEVEELVEPGEIDPEHVHTAGHLRATRRARWAAARKAHRARHDAETEERKAMALTREQLAARVAQELRDGAVRQPRHRLADARAELRARRASTSCCRARTAFSAWDPIRTRTRKTPISSTPAKRPSPCCPGASFFDSRDVVRHDPRRPHRRRDPRRDAGLASTATSPTG